MTDTESSGGGSVGIGIGGVLAVIMSWTVNHSVWWAILHGLLGWIYVIARFTGCAEGGEP